jgi:hypothetical protein
LSGELAATGDTDNIVIAMTDKHVIALAWASGSIGICLLLLALFRQGMPF